jgi:hypothetical protein
VTRDLSEYTVKTYIICSYRRRKTPHNLHATRRPALNTNVSSAILLFYRYVSLARLADHRGGMV